MPRYIDADNLIADFESVGGEFDVDGIKYIINTYHKPADVVPVVRGEWKMDTDPDDGDCRCSSCKVCIDALHKRNHGLLNALGFKLHTFYNYCPNCGARMGGEE